MGSTRSRDNLRSTRRSSMESIVDSLYRRMRQDIVECELTPGQALSEIEVGRLYAASRTPVREACRRLEHEGLVVIAPFRGYTIAPLSVAEFHDLEEMQLIFEPEAARLAAQRAGEAELAEMRRLAGCEYQAGDKASYRAFIQTNFQLHRLIAQATRNQRLGSVVGNVHVRLMRFFYLGISLDAYGPALVAEHVAMVEAICCRAEDEARELALAHIRAAMQRSARHLLHAIRFGEAVFDMNRTVQGTVSGEALRTR